MTQLQIKPERHAPARPNREAMFRELGRALRESPVGVGLDECSGDPTGPRLKRRFTYNPDKVRAGSIRNIGGVLFMYTVQYRGGSECHTWEPMEE